MIDRFSECSAARSTTMGFVQLLDRDRFRVDRPEPSDNRYESDESADIRNLRVIEQCTDEDYGEANSHQKRPEAPAWQVSQR